MRLQIVLVIVSAGIIGACRGNDAPTAPNANPVNPNDTTSLGNAVTGTWQRTGYAVNGTVSVAVANGVAQVTFSSNFSIAQTPGPFVYLNTTNNPNSGMPLRIGALKARSGAQTYTFQIPAGVRYSYVLIWCDPFNAAMAEAVIR